MAVGTGIWGGLFVRMSIVLDDVTGGVVAGPATGVNAVATLVASVHVGMDALAVVFTIYVTEIGIVVLGTGVMTA